MWTKHHRWSRGSGWRDRRLIVFGLIVVLMFPALLALAHGHEGSHFNIHGQCDVHWAHAGSDAIPPGVSDPWAFTEEIGSCGTMQTKIFYYLTGFGWLVVVGPNTSNTAWAYLDSEYSSFYQHTCGDDDIYGSPTCVYKG